MKPAHISQHLCPPGAPAEVGSESTLSREDFEQVQVLSRTVRVQYRVWIIGLNLTWESSPLPLNATSSTVTNRYLANIICQMDPDPDIKKTKRYRFLTSSLFSQTQSDIPMCFKYLQLRFNVLGPPSKRIMAPSNWQPHAGTSTHHHSYIYQGLSSTKELARNDTAYIIQKDISRVQHASTIINKCSYIQSFIYSNHNGNTCVFISHRTQIAFPPDIHPFSQRFPGQRLVAMITN